ncbi:MAG: SGNH/GDSL hydrolase family protein [Eubacteriales bacterium]|nr:SGNH/GDSL hydrolase family protein [Eubacteriales bacterium]
MTEVSQNILKALSKNILNTKIESGLLFFERFTGEQLELFGANPHYRSRSLCPSGACIDFYSDTESIRLGYTVFERARDWMYFDLFVNDNYISSTGFDTIQNESGQVDFNVPGSGKNSNRITIYVPHLVRIGISSLEISTGSKLSKIKNNRKTILCLGDSITQGMEAKYPSSAFPVKLARHFKADLINQGIGGYVFNKSSLTPDFKFDPHIITVAYGTNDWEVVNSISEFYKKASVYLEELKGKFPMAKIFVISPTWRIDMNEPKKCGTFNEVSSSLSNICGKDNNFIFVDGLTMMPNDPQFFTDGLHPGDEGFKHYGKNLISKIETGSA